MATRNPIVVLAPLALLIALAGLATATSQLMLAWSVWPAPQAQVSLAALPCSMISLAVPLWYGLVLGAGRR